MSFQSLAFALFLAAAVTACLAAGRKSRAAGQAALTAASAVFCLLGRHGAASLGVLLLGCAITRAAAGKLAVKRCRKILWAACGYHIAVLAAFKYPGFLTGGATALPFAPIGLSFFTFQQLWYLKEVWSGEYVPARTDSAALYALFFPTVTSGPILRPSAFFPQLMGASFLRPDWPGIAAGLYAISLGMAKKVLLADNLGVAVNNGWADPAALSAPGAWLVMLCYTLQLYFDFSGYCDIAAGCARLLGVRLPVNFNSPYRALSVTEFWKRWHMTLTGFLRSCVYFPLGGSRKGPGRTYGNILLVFLLSGLWHGAGWTFIIWGVLHGLAQVAERAWGAKRARLPKAAQWAITFLFLNLAWVFFRSPSPGAAGALLAAAVSGGGGVPWALLAEGVFASEVAVLETLLPQFSRSMPALVLTALPLIGMAAALWPRNVIGTMDGFFPGTRRLLVCAALLVWSVLSFSGVAAFIYSNF